MYWGCAPSQGMGELIIFNDAMTKKYYVDILKNEFTRSATKFCFVDPYDSKK